MTSVSLSGLYCTVMKNGSGRKTTNDRKIIKLMKLINKALICVCILLGTFTVSKAQHSITVDVSQNVTNLSFTNSLGKKDKNYNSEYSTSYTFGYRYSLDNGVFFPGKLGMRKGGASYVFDSMNYFWDLQYADFRLGAGYNYSLGDFSVHASVTGYVGFLLKANQVINNENFDIKESDQFSNNDFGIFISPGVSYPVNDQISLYLDLNYMMGLKNLESTTDQKSKNTLFGASLGVAFSL
jgi:hypothetical protein